MKLAPALALGLLACLVLGLLLRVHDGGAAGPSPAMAGAENRASSVRVLEKLDEGEPGIVSSPPPAPSANLAAALAPTPPSISSSPSRKRLGRVVLACTFESDTALQAFRGFDPTRLQCNVELAIGDEVKCESVHFDPAKGSWCDLTRHFDADSGPPTELRIEVTAIRVEAGKSTITQSVQALDVSSVPARRAVEAEVRLDARLATPVPSFVRGTLECEGACPDTRWITRAARSVGGREHTAWLTWRSCYQNRELQTPSYPGGRVQWLALADGHAPLAVEVVCTGVGVHELGRLVAPRGETLRGRIVPPIPGASLRLRCLEAPGELARFNALLNEGDIDGDPLSALGRIAPIDAAGEFEVQGLVSTRYNLALVDVPGLGDVELAPSIVEAPFSAVRIELPLSAVDVRLQRNGRPAAQERFELRRPQSSTLYYLRRAARTDARARTRSVAPQDVRSQSKFAPLFQPEGVCTPSPGAGGRLGCNSGANLLWLRTSR